MLFEVSLTRSAEKEFSRLDSTMQDRVLKRLHGLAENPFPRGSRKLEGAKDAYRIRVGDYRILYSVLRTNREVVVAAIAHRRDVYRDK